MIEKRNGRYAQDYLHIYIARHGLYENIMNRERSTHTSREEKKITKLCHEVSFNNKVT